MATIAATAPRTRQAVSPGIWLPAYSLWQREIVRFYRQKARVAGVIASPLIFWVVLGAGFAAVGCVMSFLRLIAATPAASK